MSDFPPKPSQAEPLQQDEHSTELSRRAAQADPLAERPGEPPIVARMVIEIRSDGSRTIARGALEDVLGGERVALEAHGTTPLQLAAKLTKSLLTAPLLARQMARGGAGRAVRALLGRKSKDNG